MVEGLPAHTFRTDEGDVALKCPTEIAITDRREKELDRPRASSRSCHCKGTDYAAFFGGQTAPEAEALQHRRGQRQRAPLGAAAVHPGRLALRPLHQGR